MSKKSLAISFVIGALISGAALYLSFRRVPLHDLATYLSSVNYWWILPSVGLMVVSFLMRVFRYQIILGSVTRLGFWQCFHPMAISFFMNCILPGRVGELARPALIGKQHNVSFFGVAATVAAERVLDLIALLSFFILVAAVVPIDPNLQMHFGKYVLSRATLVSIGQQMVRLFVVLLAGMVLVNLKPTRRIMEKIILASPEILFFLSKETREKLRTRVCMAIIGIMERIGQGFDLIKSPKKLIACLVMSFGIWFVVVCSYPVFALGFPGIRIHLLEWMTVNVIICFFISLPSVPGFWGLWEAGGVFALALFGVDATSAGGFTLVNHVAQMLPVMVMGMIASVITGVSIWQVASREEQAPSPGPTAGN